MAEFLKGVKALIIEQKIGKARKEILKKQLEKRGGIVLNQFTEDVNYVIADGSLKYDRILKILKLNSIPDHVQVVQAEWLSACIIAEELLSNMTYKIEPMTTIPLKRCGQTVTPPTQAAVKFEPSADSGATPDTSPTKVTSCCMMYCDALFSHLQEGHVCIFNSIGYQAQSQSSGYLGYQEGTQRGP